MSAMPQTDSTGSGAITMETRNFGSLTVRDDQIIMFTPGLLGFSQYHRYVLIEHIQESPFMWLQCVDNPNLAFVVIDPAFIVPNYNPAQLPEVMKDLAADSPQDLKTLVILTIPPGKPEEMTANLMGPLVINLKNRRGKQIVLEGPEYSHKHPILAK